MRTLVLKVDVDQSYQLLPAIQEEIQTREKEIEIIQVVISACNTQALIIYKKKE